MITDVLIPGLLFLLMAIVGTDLVAADLRAVTARPLIILGGTVAQIVLLPLVALGICGLWRLEPELAAGLVLIAACPGGALSNFYCLLARTNVALSVTLTAVSSLVSFAVLPLLLAAVLPLALPPGAVEVPIRQVMLQLVLFLLLPVVLGMSLRRVWPRAVESRARALRAAGMLLLGALVALVAYDQRGVIASILTDAIAAALLFTLAAGLTGWGVAVVLGLPRGERLVFLVEFAVRNIGVAVLIAAGSLDRPEFAAFGALFVTLQFPLMSLLSLRRRPVSALDANP